jgi:hypothetical protein
VKERRAADARRFGLFWPYGQTTHSISKALADRNAARFAQVPPRLREAGVWQPPAERGWSW